MRKIMILTICLAATAAAAQTKTYDPKTASPKERAAVETAFLLVAAKACAAHRDDASLIGKAVEIARPKLVNEGYSDTEITNFIAKATADDSKAQPATVGPMSCALFDGAMKKAAN